MFNYHPPSHLQDTGWQETPEKPAGLGRDRVYTRTNTYTHSFHSSTLWVMGFLTICLIQSTNKTRAGGLLRQCSATLEWVWAHETHICSQVYTCPSVITRKRKRLSNCIFVFPKLFHSAGFHKRNIKAPPKFFFLSSLSNVLIGLWAMSLRQSLGGYICSGIIYSALLFLKTWQSA